MYCVDHVVLWHESNADTDQKIKAQSKLNSFNWEKNNQKRINMAQHYIPFSTDSRYNTWCSIKVQSNLSLRPNAYKDHLCYETALSGSQKCNSYCNSPVL